MRRWLPAISYDRPVTVLMAFLALLVIGSISWYRISNPMLASYF